MTSLTLGQMLRENEVNFLQARIAGTKAWLVKLQYEIKADITTHKKHGLKYTYPAGYTDTLASLFDLPANDLADFNQWMNDNGLKFTLV